MKAIKPISWENKLLSRTDCPDKIHKLQNSQAPDMTCHFRVLYEIETGINIRHTGELIEFKY